ncbi:MAG: class II glutamine amidotransferase [Rhodospirillaceae bacterium]|nr:class II glutamine amidotransferase [Rhodospirillaceae bacterium]
MCRLLAYLGEPIFLATLVTSPSHSLVYQSLHAAETKPCANEDGFGIGWYGDGIEPGLYRAAQPAWSDANLQSLCEQVCSRLFVAHVRAATGTAINRANCHPFSVKRFMFIHNGQIGGWPSVRQKVEAMIPNEFYSARTGTTDSEAIFLAALANGMEQDPVRAVTVTLERVKAAMYAKGVTAPLRFAAVLTDGEGLWAFRWACDGKPPSLYWREGAGGLIVASEPIDGTRWQAVPDGACLVARPGEPIRIEYLHLNATCAMQVHAPATAAGFLNVQSRP